MLRDSDSIFTLEGLFVLPINPPTPPTVMEVCNFRAEQIVISRQIIETNLLAEQFSSPIASENRLNSPALTIE